MQIHLSLLAILLLLNIIPDKIVNRKRYILPISFLLFFIYWAIRYDYGFDYWTYYDSFYAGVEGKLNRGFGESGYYLFSHLFNKFYQVIIAQSFIVSITLFHLVRKHISPDYYWLFFFLLFLVSKYHFVMISALRNSLSACIMYWAIDYCYIRKKSWFPFFVFVFIATMFHTTALFYLALPIVHYFISKFKGSFIWWGLLVINVLSMFVVNVFFEYVISLSSLTESFVGYSDRIGESNMMGFMVKTIILLPTYYLCQTYDKQKIGSGTQRLFVLAFFWLALDLFGLNFGGRFTLYLFFFFIAALTVSCQNNNRTSRLIILGPYLLVVLWQFYRYIQSLLGDYYIIEGNYLFYKTIFDTYTLP